MLGGGATSAKTFFNGRNTFLARHVIIAGVLVNFMGISRHVFYLEN
jgi:hypothetical protein